jgi:predicted nucleic acid-binding protein
MTAAMNAGCTRLYSEDLQHGQRIERLTIENPFLEG